MGMMIDGRYLAKDPAPDTDADGRFHRHKANIRNWITKDGAPGPTGEGGFPADASRYRLFAAWNCPWAHRVMLVNAVKGLGIATSYARPRRTDEGWVFDQDGEYSDPGYGATALHQVYARADPPYTGRITTPLLWDTVADRAVSNESADIMRMLDRAFPDGPDLAPDELIPQIDAWGALIYPTLNNGVYRAGFARTQEAYDEAVAEVFATLERIEDQLERTPFLCGDALTEADLRLFPTLARFDVAYHGAFRCNLRRIADHPAIWRYARSIFAMPRVADTVRFWVYKQGYFSPSPLRNPYGIVPAGPRIDWAPGP